MIFREAITLDDLINIIRAKDDEKYSYCIYGTEDGNSPTLKTVYYIDEYPEIDDDDEERYSDFVTKNELELFFREELLQDVITNAVHQKKDVTNSEILEAIKYYDERDVFITF